MMAEAYGGMYTSEWNLSRIEGRVGGRERRDSRKGTEGQRPEGEKGEQYK